MFGFCTLKTRCRIARKLIRKYNARRDEEIDIALSLDGSGELGSRIYQHFADSAEAEVNIILKKLKLTRSAYEKYLRRALLIESSFGHDVPEAWLDILIVERP